MESRNRVKSLLVVIYDRQLFMMPGTLDHPILTFIADLFPMSYALESIMNVVTYDAGLKEIALPVTLMLLIGVIYMGIGINLVERKSSS